jgi:two-component system chemotaxis response regulator CheB
MLDAIIVDDSAFMRKLLRGILENLGNINVVATARDAYDARDKIKAYEPDFITLDIEMPGMDGITFLKNLQRLHPMPVIVISSHDTCDLEVKQLGAIEFIHKDNLSSEKFKEIIKDIIKKNSIEIEKYKNNKDTKSKDNKITQKDSRSQVKKSIKEELPLKVEKRYGPDKILLASPAKGTNKPVIAIGSSTGGVESLSTIFQKLPSNLPPIIISQHIPENFSTSLAKRLDSVSNVRVYEAQNNQILESGCAYLSPGNRHLTIKKSGINYIINLIDGVKVSRHKPSVDVMFRSLNNTVGKNSLAIILTGMGDDGSSCIKELYDNGAKTIAQSEKTCVVFGMPAKAIENKAITKIVDLDKIYQEIIDFA